MVLTYFYLFIAVVLEAIATTALKLTEQFTKPVPIAVMVVCYAASFYFFTLVLKNIPLGITYALWSGLGLVLIIIIGAVKEIHTTITAIGTGFVNCSVPDQTKERRFA